MTEEQTMRELLCESLRFIEKKIEDGKVTINDIRTMTETLCSTLGIDATIKDIANFYDTSEINVRSLIKRRILGEARPNEGFTFTNPQMKEALVVIGPTTSGAEFKDTLIHELHHLAVAVADSLGVDLESETPAYIAGDSARELSDVICSLGCST